MAVEITRNADTFILKLEVDCPPHGKRFLTCECCTDEKDAWLDDIPEIGHRWPIIWPKIAAKVESLVREYERPAYFSSDDFALTLIGDAWCKADFGIEVYFGNEDGWWVVFFRDFKVVHAQPSF